MTLRLTQLVAAAAALAIAVVSLTGPSARAFTIETLGGGSDGNSRFADPDDQVKKFGQGATPFGQSGPSVQFGVGQGPLGFRGAPYGSFQGSANPVPPDPYGPRSLGNNN